MNLTRQEVAIISMALDFLKANIHNAAAVRQIQQMAKKYYINNFTDVENIQQKFTDVENIQQKIEQLYVRNMLLVDPE